MLPFVKRLAAAAALASISLFALAADEPVAPAEAPVAAQGVRVFVDPETGTLVDRPVTAEQQAAAAGASEASFDQPSMLPERMHPSGAVVVDLQGRHEVSTVASVGADGKLAFHCDADDHSGHDHSAPAQPAREVR
jgi:hypothetical protein